MAGRTFFNWTLNGLDYNKVTTFTGAKERKNIENHQRTEQLKNTEKKKGKRVN
jgi:hypothetical protein